MSRQNRSSLLLNHYKWRKSNRVNTDTPRREQNSSGRGDTPIEFDQTFTSESQRSDWIFASSFADPSVTSLSKVKTEAWSMAEPTSMTLKEISTPTKTSKTFLIKLTDSIHINKWTVCIFTSIMGMLCVGIPLTAVLAVWSTVGFTGQTTAGTLVTTQNQNSIATVQTTLSTATQTTTSCAASPPGRGTMLTISGNTPNSWTQYRLNYTATTTRPTLVFGFQSENNRPYYFDTVSVVDRIPPSVELLRNPNFENSTGSPVGWIQWCTSACGSGRAGTVVTNTSCQSTSGKCFVDNCHASSGMDYLAQSFQAVIGRTYNISFWVSLGGSGTATDNRLNFDIAP